MQGIDLNKINEIKSFATNFRSLGIISAATGKAHICADSEQIIKMLLKCFDKENNPNYCFLILESSKIKRNILSGKYEVDVVFLGGGISEYEFTVSHLFQLAYDEIGLDYEQLKESNFSIRFEYEDLARATDQIYKVACMELSHKKGEDPTEPRFVRGNITPYIYNLDNIVSILLSANSIWITDTSIDDTASLFLNEVEVCTYKFPKEEIVSALRRNAEVLKKVFHVSLLSDIYDLKDNESEEFENLKEILEEASK